MQGQRGQGCSEVGQEQGSRAEKVQGNGEGGGAGERGPWCAGHGLGGAEASARRVLERMRAGKEAGSRGRGTGQRGRRNPGRV